MSIGRPFAEELEALAGRAARQARDLPDIARRTAALCAARGRAKRGDPGEANARDTLAARFEKAARRAKTEAELTDLLAGLAGLFGRPALARALLRGDAASGAELVYACPRCGARVAFTEEAGHLIGDDDDDDVLAWSADAAALAGGDTDPALWLPQIAAQAEYFRLSRRLLQLLGKARCPACARRFSLLSAGRGSQREPEPAL